MKDGGSIIVNGSGAWQKGIPMYSTYSATKAALRSFVRTWTAEFAGKGKPHESGHCRWRSISRL
jgi:NAD(P)-dependent dehydrogenase (short-subunit alcohol dehydrogenase family)